MKKLLFIPILSFGITSYPDFSMCYKKYKNYSIIPISKNYSVSSTKPKSFIRYDEVLGLYLLKTKNKKYLHFKKSHIGVWIASITKNSIYSGNYAEYQTSLYSPAKTSSTTKKGAIICDIFCNPIGIGVKGGFLSQKFISSFTKVKPKIIKNPLKFAGIIFDENLTITKIIPNSIAQKHYISVGTKIIKIDGIKVSNKKEIIGLLKSGKDVTITIKQDGLDFRFKVKK